VANWPNIFCISSANFYGFLQLNRRVCHTPMALF
jgi:hypothetical protein